MNSYFGLEPESLGLPGVHASPDLHRSFFGMVGFFGIVLVLGMLGLLALLAT